MRTNTESKTSSKQEWKKRNIPLLKFGIDKDVSEIEGIFLKRKPAGENVDEKTGEVKERYTLIFENPDTKEKFQVWENAGLRNAMSMNDISEGEHVRLVHLGKVERAGKVGTVNTYDVFTLN